MSIEDLKAKIEQNPTGFIITEQDIQLALQGGLTGFISIQSDSFLAATPIGIILGLGTGEESRSVEDVFVGRFSVTIKDKQYQNLSFNQVRYAINIFDENSNEFKEVVKNLTNDILGPALSQYSFGEFDNAVSIAVNEQLAAGRTYTFTNLPSFRIGGPPSVLVSTFPNDTVPELNPSIESAKWNEIASAYESQFGSDPNSAAGSVAGDITIQLNGNVSTSTTEFQLAEVEAGGSGLFDAIIDFFVDYRSPSSVVNLQYKMFLVKTLRDYDSVDFDAFFDNHVEEAADTITKNLLYDFEYERREGLYRAIKTDPDASVEDILNAAEAAALDGLDSLAGEGGVGQNILDPDQIEERQRFFEQCILLAQMDSLKEVFTEAIKTEGEVEQAPSPEPSSPPTPEGIHQPSPYQERFYMVEAPSGRNDRLVNFLNAPSDTVVNDFLNLTPDIQSFLLPKIRLYKVFNEGNALKQTEFIFRNSTDSTNVLNNLFKDNDKFFRGSGYGIKDFSISFEGGTPATAKNDMVANLTLFFQDFSDFITPVETEQGTFSFVDLIFYDKKNTNNPAYGYGSSHPDQYSPAYYRIRADIGWQAPENLPQFDDACKKRGLDPDNIRDVIARSNKSFYLNMVEHDLNFKTDGTVEIKAQYRGYVESVLKGTTMDALTDSTLIDERKSRQEALTAATRTCSPGELARIKRIYSAEEQLIIEDLYTRTFGRLLELDKVRTFQVGYDGGFRKEGYFANEPSITDVGTNRTSEITDEHTYYFLGDLLYVMLDAMYADNSAAEPIGKTKLILPTIEFENFFEDSGTFAINLAQIPISNRYFGEWWAQHVIKPKKKAYPIMFYLRDILNNLVADALIDVCLNKNYKKSFNFQTTSINASGEPLAGAASNTDPIISLDQNDLPFVVEENADINDITNYVLVYAAYSTTLPSGVGKYTEDLQNGVYHFHLGQDRGIVYDVKFSKVDMAYIREARYLREGIDGLLQLGAVYRATINMFGNTLFYPGMLIYINPFGIGGEQFMPNNSNTIANKLGLGGYHLITKVNCSIASGLFKTTIEAMFVYSGDGDTRFNIQGKQKERDENDITTPEEEEEKCAGLVNAVRADYLATLAGDEVTLRAPQAIIDTNADNLREAGNRIREASNGAVDITLAVAEEEDPEVSTTGIPNTGINLGFSPEDLLGDTE